MNIESNEKLIRRNARIAQISMIAGLAVLVLGMVLSFRSPEQFGLSLAALLVGFTLSQIGIFFGNRWGRHPRPDEVLNQALKGLDGRYTLYHYRTPTAHLLVGPAGIWALFPRNQRGVITFEKGRYRQRGGGIMMSYLKMFAQEGLGRPDLDIEHDRENLEKYFISKLETDNVPPIQAALVFTNDKVTIDIAEDADLPAVTLTAGKLKEHIRKFAKGKPISLDRAQEIQRLFSES
jgi:hypothetical protein